MSFYDHEAKFPAFNKMPMDDICIGMKVSGDVRWLHIPGIKRGSLHSIFAAGIELQTNRSRSAWKGLMVSSSLQHNCNKEGLNVKDGDSSKILVRIGYVANNEYECNSCDSFIGIGTSITKWPSCGNFADIYVDNGKTNIPAMCYILIK